MQQASTTMQERAGRAAQPLGERLRIPQRLLDHVEQRWDGAPVTTPVLHIDDFSGIPFLVDITGVEEYQHRARLRAREGDLYGAVTDPTPGYEDYCRESLGLGPIEFLRAEPTNTALDLAAACGSGRVRRRLVEIARSAGGLAVHPFMGIDEVWRLAEMISGDAGVSVVVIGSPPPVTWVANDKQVFSEVVERVLGSHWLVETRCCRSVPELRRRLRELARRHARVALKRLRCASAMGNAVFDSVRIRELEPPELEEEVRGFLDRTQWDGRESVLAVAWEEADHSPSTQLWIPPLGAGRPRVEGVYEQLLQGERRVFVGSRPSQLPSPVNRALSEASLEVACALQSLGYVGRCSFDFLVVGDLQGEFELRFTECNGRWGGTSTPMALLDRLLPGPRPPYRARDFVHPKLVGATFTDLLALTGEALWNRVSGRGRFVFYNTGPLSGFGKLDVIALGASQAEADAALEDELPRLWGL